MKIIVKALVAGGIIWVTMFAIAVIIFQLDSSAFVLGYLTGLLAAAAVIIILIND